MTIHSDKQPDRNEPKPISPRNIEVDLTREQVPGHHTFPAGSQSNGGHVDLPGDIYGSGKSRLLADGHAVCKVAMQEGRQSLPKESKVAVPPAEANPTDLDKIGKELGNKDDKIREKAFEAFKTVLKKDPRTTIRQLSEPIAKHLAGSTKYWVRETASVALKEMLKEDATTTVKHLGKALERIPKDWDLKTRLGNALSPYVPAPRTVSDELKKVGDLSAPITIADFKTIVDFKNLSEKDRQDQIEMLSSWQKCITDAKLESELSIERINQQLKDLENFKTLQEKISTLAGFYLKGQRADNTDVELKALKDLTWFSRVTSLELVGTNVTDAGLEHLKGSTGLKSLNLADTNVTDAGLEHLKGLTGLTQLDVTSPKITDSGVKALNGLTELKRLCLGGEKITDAGMKHLRGLTGLKILVLSGTSVTESGLKELRARTGLRVIKYTD